MAERSRSEKSIMNDTLVQVSALPRTVVYRQNSGMAWQGQPVRARPGDRITVEPGMTILREARPVHFGVPGAGDIVGVAGGKAIQIETKSAGGATRDQQRLFGLAWEKAGGIYILARSPEEAVTAVGAVGAVSTLT